MGHGTARPLEFNGSGSWRNFSESNNALSFSAHELSFFSMIVDSMSAYGEASCCSQGVNGFVITGGYAESTTLKVLIMAQIHEKTVTHYKKDAHKLAGDRE